ncbi:tRNA lysidine(34) synthetase TilS [Candidatus Karelsulcia muelleri]|uniref:tRNA lysidine(34) synthetase TilS n=1 Tax=Candidatus Karelsulcia muelleri TaxID=336810 RepID=UPI0023645A5C|nr:tRNA lysidine(34) synthetase TilS [Candidatus Karelsulcia muelleri]WDE42177.1 tRNA lysidine(34) synthetase TilS [Candidatus Karelsulcia muelleri]WDR79166.1 tRNA lysidine(34) synthetase TilS [Candidatus Karelsulcia muelleri]
MLNLKKVLTKLNKQINFKNKKIYIAVSGGVDSMVLLNIFIKIRLKIISLRIEVLHCNFNLRVIDSKKEEELIKKICKRNKIVYHMKKFSFPSNQSIQLIARKLRFFWFKKMLKTNCFNYIALGHNLNDSIETFFINIKRGTSLKGMKGIIYKKKYLIRPLIDFSRSDILKYAKKNHISWMEDKSNKSQKYLRNKIRKDLSNVLDQNFYEGFKKTFIFFQEENLLIKNHLKIIEQYICKKTKNQIFFFINKILNLNFIKFYLHKYFSKYGFLNIKDIIKIIISKNGKQIFSKDLNYVLLKKQNQLILIKERNE